MSRLTIVHEDASMRQAVYRNVQIVAWYDAPSLEQMHAWDRCAQSVAGRWHGQSALINIIVDGVPRFSSEVREAVSEYTREGVHKAGAAHVILVSGLLGSSVRAFLSTVMLLGRPPNPTKVFGTLEDAARWMAKNLNERSTQTWDEDELVRACREAIEREGGDVQRR